MARTSKRHPFSPVQPVSAESFRGLASVGVRTAMGSTKNPPPVKKKKKPPIFGGEHFEMVEEMEREAAGAGKAKKKKKP